MKITAIRAIPVIARGTDHYAWAHGKGPYFARSIIEIETDAGLVGLGEAPRGDTAELINRRFAPRLIGLDPGEWQTARQRCLPRHREWGLLGDPREFIAFGGIDMALWDLVGKAAGKPLFRLLGGPVRETAPFVAYVFSVAPAGGLTEADVPATMARLAVQAITESGAAMCEFKVGRNSIDCDIATIVAVREALGPDIALSADSNMASTLPEARRLLAGVADARLANFEEPVASLGEMEQLHAEFGVPMSTHCSNFEVLRHYPGIEGVAGDIHFEGGIVPTLALASAAQTHNRQFWLHASKELGISWAARCHFGMVCPGAVRPAQAVMNWVEDDLVLGEPWLLRNGGCRPPETPGLGVELDPEAFAHAAETYRTQAAHGMDIR
jgi:glucarate dehydratase